MTIKCVMVLVLIKTLNLQQFKATMKNGYSIFVDIVNEDYLVLYAL